MSAHRPKRGISPTSKALLATAAASTGAAWFANRLSSAATRACGNPLALGDDAAWRTMLLDAAHLNLSPDGSTVPLLLAAGTGILVAGLGTRLTVATTLRNADAAGSSRWGSPDDYADLRDQTDESANYFLSRNVAVAHGADTAARASLPNDNTLVCGGSGSMKTQTQVVLNCMVSAGHDRAVGEKVAQQPGASHARYPGRDMFVTDPKGANLRKLGHLLVGQGYQVHVLNLVDLALSDVFNPCSYCRSEADVRVLVSSVLDATNEGRKSSEPIWDSGEFLGLDWAAEAHWLWLPRDRFCLPEVFRTYASHRHGAERPSYVTPSAAGDLPSIDELYREVTTGLSSAGATSACTADPTAPQAPAAPSALVRNTDGYMPASDGGARARGEGGGAPDTFASLGRRYLNSPEDTDLSFMISHAARFSALFQPDVERVLTGDDEFGLDTIGMGARPQAWFVVTSDHESSLSGLAAIAVSQAVLHAYDNADKNGGHLRRDALFMLDEFLNLGRMEQVKRWLATCRSRGIGFKLFVQSIADIDQTYGKDLRNAIWDNCSSTVYLAGGQSSSAAEISERLGKQTIRKSSTSTPAGASGGAGSESVDVLGRELMTAEEVSHLPIGKCIVWAAERRPVVDDKFVPWEHPAYDPVHMYDDKLPPAWGRDFDYRRWAVMGRPVGLDYVEADARACELEDWLAAAPWQAMGGLEVTFDARTHSLVARQAAGATETGRRWPWEAARLEELASALAPCAHASAGGHARGSRFLRMEQEKDDARRLAQIESCDEEPKNLLSWVIAHIARYPVEVFPQARAGEAVWRMGWSPVSLGGAAGDVAARFAPTLCRAGDDPKRLVAAWVAEHPGVRDPLFASCALGAPAEDLRMWAPGTWDWPEKAARTPAGVGAAHGPRDLERRWADAGRPAMLDLGDEALAGASPDEALAWWPAGLTSALLATPAEGPCDPTPASLQHVREGTGDLDHLYCPVLPGGQEMRRPRAPGYSQTRASDVLPALPAREPAG